MGWNPVKPEELQVGTRFRMKGKQREYVVRQEPRRYGDHFIIETDRGPGKMRLNAELEYKSDFV